MSAPVLFPNYNLNNLTALLQARDANNGAAPVPAATPALKTNSAGSYGQPMPNLLLAAARGMNVPTQATGNGRDPSGYRGEEPSLQVTMASAVSALSGKRPSGPMFGPAENFQHQVEGITKRARRLRSWDEMFSALVRFHASHRTAAVPLNFPEDPELGLWVENQRRHKFLLSPEERYKLDLIGFQWEYAPSASFVGGNTAFAASQSLGTPSADRVFLRRDVPAAGLFGARFGAFGDKINSAAAAAPALNKETQQWNLMFQKLQAFHAVHKHCDVHLQSQDMLLCMWAMQQKELYRCGVLPMEHRAKLEALGFFKAAVTAPSPAKQAMPKEMVVSSPSVPREDDSRKKRVRTFDENFEALLEYKKIHGNVDVPQKYEKDRKLGIWVKNVRQHPLRHTQEQRDRLDSIGFKWRKLQLDEQWTDAFRQLLDYKEKYGDCNVPSRWKKCPALARWVHTQRTMYRRNKLLEDRKEKLEEAGFVWDCNAMRDDEAFHENYEKLLSFKKARGHCNVPNKYRRDRPLGRWAAKMRDLYLYDQLDADRRKALNDIGFVWEQTEEIATAQDGALKSTTSSAKAVTKSDTTVVSSDSDTDCEGED